ncbi:MAG: endolytic transglycosylase MltG [bacterium]
MVDITPVKEKTILIVLLVILLADLGWFGWYYYYSLAPTYAPFADKIIRIKRGTTLKEAARLLSEEKLIKECKIFTFWAADRKIKAGEYRLTPRMSASEIMAVLERGKSVLYRLTVPEGFRGEQIAELVHRKGLAKKEVFFLAFRDIKLLNSLGIEGKDAEGYLFPDTYFFPKGIKAEVIIREMVGQFENRFTEEMRNRATDLGWSLHEVVTLASLIEKEAGHQGERSLISSVFHNRLKRGERLYSDPTVMYGLSRFDQRLTKKDLASDSPYNTYKHKGLPPGPIANPGLASIKAALYPAKTDYRFFVSKNDGTHLFSRTLREHNRAVLKYQKRKNQEK